MLHSKLKTASDSNAAYICNACTHCQIQYNYMAIEQKSKKFNIRPVLLTQLLGMAMSLSPKELGITDQQGFEFYDQK